MFDLKGKTALVTGSTQGIGYAIARLLIERGAEVYIHCSGDEEKVRRVAKELGSTRFVIADLSERDAAERIYAVTGPLDIVVANASVQYRDEWYNKREISVIPAATVVSFPKALGITLVFNPNGIAKEHIIQI